MADRLTRVTFLLAEEPERTIEHAGGAESLMELARRHGVPGVLGTCGGVMACATCHIHIEPAWTALVGGASGEEREIIDFTSDPRPESRLGCQVWLTRELDGLRVRLASS